MSQSEINHYIETFTTNVAMLLQRQPGYFERAVTMGSYTGNGGVVVDQYGPIQTREIITRGEPMPRGNSARERVWIYPRSFDTDGEDFYRQDDLKTLNDPRGPVAENISKALRRRKDELINGAFFGDMKKGVAGESTEVFDTTNHRVDAAVGASGDTGLNVEKINAGIEIMLNNNVDLEMEECWIAISPKQNRDLIRQEQVLSEDKQRAMGITVENGVVKRMHGCNVVVSTLIPRNANYTLCPMWVKSGMHLGMWDDVRILMNQRADIREVPDQLYGMMTANATRVEAGRVIQIECTEA